MTLSRRGDYVVRSAVALARAYDSGEPRKVRQVVAEMGVPQTFAPQILADLVRAGLATSRAGKDGGYRLSRDPGDIALIEVIEAGEGPLRAERCALGEGPCRWDAVCPLHETWRAATDALREVLGTTTLADVAAQDIAIEEGRVVAPADSHRHGGSSILVEDSVQVEAGCPAVVERLRGGQLMTAALVGAFEQVEPLRASLLGSGPRWSPAEVSTSCRLDRGDPPPAGGEPSGAAGAGASTRIGMAFEAIGPSGTSSHGDFVLVATALDPQRSELRASGPLRLALFEGASPAGSAERLAQVLVRTFLRRLAVVLEESASLEAASGSIGDVTSNGRRRRRSRGAGGDVPPA